jgi:hypothetical protein
MKKLFYLSLAITMLVFVSCTNKKYDIPSGYVGKVLTPTGFEKGIKEAGQVDLGMVDNDGTCNKLVLLEASTINVKEPFQKNKDGEDHRIKLKDGYIIADIYVQFALPVDANLRENAFTCITPTASKDARVSVINLEEIYNKFAKMNVRGKVREAFLPYKNVDEVMANMVKVNAEVGKIVMQVMKESKAPLELISVQLSNVKEDESIVESKNKNESANNEVQTIEKIGNALRNNPGYVEYYKWQVISEVMKANPNAVLIIDGSGKVNIQVPSKK